MPARMHRISTRPRSAFVIVFSAAAVLLSFAIVLIARPARAGTLDVPVVGGTAVKPGAFPDVVAVLGADGSMCSGTLIAADLVLTAGHCIEGDPIEVIIGSIDLVRPDGDRRRVKWARAYPDWLDSYDVGLVMLENPVSQKARAIAQRCGGRDVFKAGLPLRLVGFGLTTTSGQGDNTRLHEAVLPLVDTTCTSDPSCNAAVAPGGEFTAGGRGTDACFGDSGGPVYIETPNGKALIGVVSRGLVSWTEPCASGGVYVRADKVVAWIERVSGRKVDRLACYDPADADDHEVLDAAVCNAAGAASARALQSGFAISCAVLLMVGLRRRRLRAHASRA